MPKLSTIERETGIAPGWTIIWLHGLGADANDFVPLVPELIPPDWPATRFVFPNAPTRPVTINGGMPARAWYDIVGLELDSPEDEAGVRDSVAAVDALIAQEAERGIASDHIFVAGFSQGGAIALAAGLRYKSPLAGIIALSTYLPLHPITEPELAATNRAVPIFQGHGKADPVVKPGFGTLTRDWLTAHDYHVDWYDYLMGHQVSAEEIGDLRLWLHARMDIATHAA